MHFRAKRQEGFNWRAIQAAGKDARPARREIWNKGRRLETSVTTRRGRIESSHWRASRGKSRHYSCCTSRGLSAPRDCRTAGFHRKFQVREPEGETTLGISWQNRPSLLQGRRADELLTTVWKGGAAMGSSRARAGYRRYKCAPRCHLMRTHLERCAS